MSTTGRIHSFESCGTVDGPGIRFIVFLQGCLMRCKYCHNRDTWDTHDGKVVSVDEIISEAKSYKHFMRASGGGVTCSGGEAMLQPEFVRDFFRAAKEEGMHTCLDTNGYIRKHTDVVDEVLEASDLVMLDIKHMKDAIHQDFIGVSNKRTLDFARYLHKIGQKLGFDMLLYLVTPTTKIPRICSVSLFKIWITSKSGVAALPQIGRT